MRQTWRCENDYHTLTAVHHINVHLIMHLQFTAGYTDVGYFLTAHVHGGGYS